jgi:hypothetical protein
MKKQSNSRWWVAILIILGPLLLIYFADMIAESDIFQKTVNPLKYWRKRVAILEQKIYERQLFIKDWEGFSSHRGMRDLINYDELVREQIIKGKEPEEAKSIAAKTIKEVADANATARKVVSKIQGGVVEESYKLLDNYKRELQQARKELSKYQ